MDPQIPATWCVELRLSKSVRPQNGWTRIIRDVPRIVKVFIIATPVCVFCGQILDRRDHRAGWTRTEQHRKKEHSRPFA